MMSATQGWPRGLNAPRLGERSARLMVAAAAGLLLAACASDGPAVQQEMVRSNVQTAPADLQVLCASEAANQLGANADQILPVSSSVVQPGVFQVDLLVASQPAACTIDSEGNVLSIVAS